MQNDSQSPFRFRPAGALDFGLMVQYGWFNNLIIQTMGDETEDTKCKEPVPAIDEVETVTEAEVSADQPEA